MSAVPDDDAFAPRLSARERACYVALIRGAKALLDRIGVAWSPAGGVWFGPGAR